MSDERLVPTQDDDDTFFEDENAETDERRETPGPAQGPGEESDPASEQDPGVEPGEPGALEREDEAPQPVVEQRGRQAQLRQRPSASEKIRSLTNTARELQRRLDAFEQSRTVDQQRLFAEQQRQQQEIERQQEQEVLAMGDPARIGQFYAQRNERLLNNAIQQTRYQLFEQTDQSNFDRFLAETPRASRFLEQNRGRFDELRRLVPTASRKDIFEKVFGEVALKQLGAARTRAETRAANGAAAETTRAPAQSRSNVASERGTTGRAPRRGWEHMRNVQI